MEFYQEVMMDYVKQLKNQLGTAILETGIYKTLGIKLTDLTKDQCILSMVPKANAANLNGIIHGGIISVMLDTSIMLSIWANLPPGSRVIGVQLDVKFINPAKLEYKELQAEGSPLEIKRTLGMGQSTLYNEDNIKIAYGTAIAKIMIP